MRFDSKLVRLKEDWLFLPNKFEFCFDSKLVRLKVGQNITNRLSN